MKKKFLKIGFGFLAALTVLFIGIRVGQGSGPKPTFETAAKRGLMAPAALPDIGGEPLSVGEELAEAPAGQFTNEETIEPSEGSSISERLVIKTGNLSLLVKNTQEAVNKVKKTASELGGFVLSSRTYFTDEKEQHLKGEITIKIPQEKFDETVNKLKELALKVKSERIQGRDVTEEYTDLESRSRNLEATEVQLLKIMERSGKITEVLEVQRELTRVRNQIETTQGRMKYLHESAAMSTITCHIATEEEELPVVEEKWRPLRVAKNALRETITFWQSIGSGTIWLAIFGAPLILLAGVVHIARKLKRRQHHTNPPPST